MDPNEPSRVVKIGKCLKSELAKPLMEFSKKNQDVFTWRHANMVEIHLDFMCYRLNIDLQAKPIRQKCRTLDADRYKALSKEVDHLLNLDLLENPSILTGYPALC